MQLRCQVIVDALGGFSPITQQARGGRKPDSVVLMVGSCSTGLPEVKAADLLYSFNPLNRYKCISPQRTSLLFSTYLLAVSSFNTLEHGLHQRHLKLGTTGGQQFCCYSCGRQAAVPLKSVLSVQKSEAAVLLGNLSSLRWRHDVHVLLCRPCSR